MKNKMLGAALGLIALGGVVVGGYLLAFHAGWLGEPPGPGRIEGGPLPEAEVIARQRAVESGAEKVNATPTKQILFGDLHVHTTYSADAFLWSLPMTGGVGARPIGSACDAARYCSQLDFWAITDHAESLTPRKWRETKNAIRQCQAVSGQRESSDLISMVGFEWTQVGATPAEHYGHKNVIFRGLDDEALPERPVAASGPASQALRSGGPDFPPRIVLSGDDDVGRYFDMNAFLDEVRGVPRCDPDANPAELPPDCYETAGTPGDLVRSMEAQGLDPLMIPHGTSWGFYTPPGATLDKQLEPGMRPGAFPLVEIYSGHGNSEEYRPWQAIEGPRAAEMQQQGNATCPEPTDDYTPSCWRAGEIIRERCRDEGLDRQTCAERAAKARHDYANMGIAGHLAVKGESPEDWLNAGQCQDCFLPPFNHRPGGSVQYGLAISDFSGDGDEPTRFRWGFIASSDNHRARPGTGYKEVDRMLNTEAGGPVSEEWAERLRQDHDEPEKARSVLRSQEELRAMAGFQLTERERQSSFWLTGGLAAVHAEGRSREAVWEALERREVYATSGPRILLWFDHVGPDGRETPMGGKVTRQTPPEFRVRALGAFEQKPGCPDFVGEGLDAQRIQRICSGECYNPSDERHPIVRIEIVRIRPQVRPDEPVGPLIDDPFRVHECPADGQGCSFTFSDPAFADSDRDALYYARAVQKATPTINADNLRCEYDDEGNCVEVNPCYGDYRTDRDDDCRGPAEHRAWSSPIVIDHPGGGAEASRPAGDG